MMRPTDESQRAPRQTEQEVARPKAEGPSRPTSAVQPQEDEVEFFATGASPPVWENPLVVDPLLVIGDDRERQLVARIIRTQDRLHSNLVFASDSKTAAEASRHLRTAIKLAKALFLEIKSLIDHQVGGTQTFSTVVVSGSAIGLQAKIQKLLSPEEGSPKALILERLSFVVGLFETTALYFERNASVRESAADDLGLRTRAMILHLYLPTHEEAARWRVLGDHALAFVPTIDKAMNQLLRGRRQVMIKEQLMLGAADDRSESPLRTEGRRDAH